jgi:hypothetical protein
VLVVHRTPGGSGAARLDAKRLFVGIWGRVLYRFGTGGQSSGFTALAAAGATSYLSGVLRDTVHLLHNEQRDSGPQPPCKASLATSPEQVQKGLW